MSNYGVKTSIAKKIKFDNIDVGEDFWFSKRLVELGYRRIYVPVAVWHHHREDFAGFVRWAIRKGMGTAQTLLLKDKYRYVTFILLPKIIIIVLMALCFFINFSLGLCSLIAYLFYFFLKNIHLLKTIKEEGHNPMFIFACFWLILCENILLTYGEALYLLFVFARPILYRRKKK